MLLPNLPGGACCGKRVYHFPQWARLAGPSVDIYLGRLSAAYVYLVLVGSYYAHRPPFFTRNTAIELLTALWATLKLT